MTRKIIKNTKTFFMCEECDMLFRTQKEADDCEKRHAAENKDCHGDMIHNSMQF